MPRRRSTILAGLAMLALTGGCSSDADRPDGAAGNHHGGGGGRPQVAAESLRIRQLPMKPSSIADARERERFESLSGMVGASDVVLVGTVEDVQPGRSIGELQFRANTVRVDRILKGAYDQPSLILEEAGWWNGEPWTINHASWAQPGDRVLIAVRKKVYESWRDKDVYVLASTQSRFFLQQDGAVRHNYLADAPSAHADAFVRAQADKSAAQLLSDVAAVATG